MRINQLRGAIGSVHTELGVQTEVGILLEETQTAESLVLLDRAELAAPDLLFAECADVIYKKVKMYLVSQEIALLAADALEIAQIEISFYAASPRVGNKISDAVESPHL